MLNCAVLCCAVSRYCCRFSTTTYTLVYWYAHTSINNEETKKRGENEKKNVKKAKKRSSGQFATNNIPVGNYRLRGAEGLENIPRVSSEVGEITYVSL